MLKFYTGVAYKKIRKIAQSLLFGLLFCAIVLYNVANIVCAIGSEPKIEKFGDVDNYTQNAPITTVRLDGSKFAKDHATLISENNYFKWGTGESPQKAGSVWTSEEITVAKAETEGNTISLPSFSIAISDAAIMRDGTRKNLKVTFDDVTVFTKSGMDEYTDRFQIVRLLNNSIDISPASLAGQHFGLQTKVTCQVVDAAADDTLLLVTAEINTVRSGVSNFERIKGAGDNFSYNESMQLFSGIDSESDIYLAENVIINTDPADITNVNGYNVRFVGNGDRDFRLAAAVLASGASANVWSSAGNDPRYPLDMYFMNPNNVSKVHTSSSGENGKIELWTDGNTHETDMEENKFRKLSGGTISNPYTYAVPYGKEVTYRMTPDEGYILDKLYVNGSETNPTNTVYKLDSTEIAYYEYHFDSDTVNENQEISVTWKKYAATTDPIPVRKVITGNVPDKDPEFTIVLKRVSESDAPVIDGSGSNTINRINLNVLKGQTQASSEFSGLTFKNAGEYTYTVRELNGNVPGYTYDDKLYTVKFVIEPDQDDPDILICTQQTILDGENEVEVCEFINNYTFIDNNTNPEADTSIPSTNESDARMDSGILNTGDDIYVWLVCLLILILMGLFVFVFINKGFNKKRG